MVRAPNNRGLSMLKAHNPGDIAPPIRNGYSHGIEVPPGARMLYSSGQIAIRPDGTVPADFAEQAEVVMTNIVSILASAGMTMADVVRLTTYLTKPEQVPVFGPIRAKYLDGAKPALTSMVVSALAVPEWLIEVEVVAAKVD